MLIFTLKTTTKSSQDPVEGAILGSRAGQEAVTDAQAREE